MPLKLASQLINMFPLEGGFIKFRFCGNLISYNLQFLTLKNSKCCSLNIPERCVRIRSAAGPVVSVGNWCGRLTYLYWYSVFAWYQYWASSQPVVQADGVNRLRTTKLSHLSNLTALNQVLDYHMAGYPQ